jgi:hypothetical protein
MAKDGGAGNSRADDVRPGGDAGYERRSYVARGLAELVPSLTRAAYKKRSPAGALLMSEWAGIVGPHLAQQTEPKRLSGSQLTIACSGPMAMELQHLSTSLIERINTHAGRRLVERLRFVQEPVAAPRRPAIARQDAVPEPIEGMAPGPLNEALARLRAALRK